MKYWIYNWRAVLVSVMAVMVASCASAGNDYWVKLKSESASSGSMFRITGTVHYLELEGGLFVIRDAEDTQYNPINLPQAFRVDGMPVEAEAHRRDDMMSVGMVGPIIELLRLRERGDAKTSGLLDYWALSGASKISPV